jgi:hypothetical protein
MNPENFEKTQEEKIIQAESLGESEASFARDEVSRIKQKIDNRKAKQKKLRMILGGLSLLIVLLLLVAGYSQYKLYRLSKEEMIVTDNTTSVLPKTGEEVIKALSRHILLPSGTPQIAEVQDVTKLRESQSFFKDAENGDIVVVYNTTIILYRPSKDIVVIEGDISGTGQVKP